MIKHSIIKVRGSYYYGVDSIDRGLLDENKEVVLCIDQDNVYDKYAVSVLLYPEMIMLGHLPAEHSEKYSNFILNESIISSKISSTSLNRKGSVSIFLKVSYFDELNISLLLQSICNEELNRTGGVYCIHCMASDYYYIGSSENIKKRVARHLRDLFENNHPNNILQTDFNKYDLSQFRIFSIYKNLSQNDLLTYEKKTILDFLNNKLNLYNKTIDGTGVFGGNPSNSTISSFPIENNKQNNLGKIKVSYEQKVELESTLTDTGLSLREFSSNCSPATGSWDKDAPARLKAAREALRHTQGDAARFLGVNHATYNRWEQGHCIPAPDRRGRIWKFILLGERQAEPKELHPLWRPGQLPTLEMLNGTLVLTVPDYSLHTLAQIEQMPIFQDLSPGQQQYFRRMYLRTLEALPRPK